MRSATPAITQYVNPRARRRRRRPRRGACHEPQRRLHLQPAAGQPHAGLAQQVHRGRHRAGLRRPGRSRRLGPGVRQRVLPEAGRGALCAHAGTARQPRPHPGPQRPDAGHQRAGAQHLGDSRGRRARPRQAGAAGQAAGDAAGRAGQEARRTKTRPSSGSSARSTSRWRSRSRPWTSRASTSARNTSASTRKAKRPRTWWASPTWRTRARRAWSSPSTSELAGRPGSRRVIKDRLGPRRRGRGRAGAAGGRAATCSCRSTARCSSSPTRSCATRCMEHKAKAGSVVVLDAVSGEVLALANYPSYLPGKRQNLTGEQLRNRALTDTFEPGSTMKPFTIGAGAGKRAGARRRPPIQTAPGYVGDRRLHHPRLARARRCSPCSEVIQKSSNVGTLKIAHADAAARDVGDVHAGRLRPEAADAPSRAP